MESVSKPLPIPMVLDDYDEYHDYACQAMDTLIARNLSFTADDLRDMTPAPSNPNWTGKVFQDYARQGLIVKTGYEMARAKARRGGTLARWIGVMRRATV